MIQYLFDEKMRVAFYNAALKTPMGQKYLKDPNSKNQVIEAIHFLGLTPGDTSNMKIEMTLSWWAEKVRSCDPDVFKSSIHEMPRKIEIEDDHTVELMSLPGELKIKCSIIYAVAFYQFFQECNHVEIIPEFKFIYMSLT